MLNKMRVISKANLQYNLRIVRRAAAIAGLAVVLAAPSPLEGDITPRPTLKNVYNVASCFPGFKAIPRPNHCCGYKLNRIKRKWECIAPETIWEYDYWEPAAIVEVSCRSGFSHLSKGKIAPRQGGPQSCATGPNWFFEARVWASSGRGSADRTQSQSYEFRENTFRCQGTDTKGQSDYPHGYGIKHEGVTFNNRGPGGSSEAFISERDAAWAEMKGVAVQPKECSPGQPDVPACWGNMVPSGWVTHPNQAVAAALAGHRALHKAQKLGKVVTPRKDDWRMSMDYPFIMEQSPYAQSMGLKGTPSGNHKGSACFTPGDAGPWWYTAGQLNAYPNAIQLTPGNPNLKVHIPDGVYIFTYWVRTGCSVITKENKSNWNNLGVTGEYRQCKDVYHY